ncbi:MAG TPA: DNA-binding protein [Byssovorax sp.]|jgi:hypothetical protein
MTIAFCMTIEDQIQAKVGGFVQEISRLVREAALGAVADVLGGVSRAPRASHAQPTARAAVKVAAAKRPAAAGTKPRARRPGEKRDPAQIARLVERMYQHVLAHPGNGIETIGKALGEPTSELALPAKKLLGDKRVKTTGQRRATKYFPASGGVAKKAPAKGGKKEEAAAPSA